MNAGIDQTKARILVVQNDPVRLGLVCSSLRADGHDIIELRNPLDALRLPTADYQSINLILTEVNSRPISGIELARRLVLKGAQAHVLFMLSSRSLAAVIARSLGQSAVIQEPFTGPELRTSVKKCLSIPWKKSGSAAPKH